MYTLNILGAKSSMSENHSKLVTEIRKRLKEPGVFKYCNKTCELTQIETSKYDFVHTFNCTEKFPSNRILRKV